MIAPGANFGPYQVIAELGAGGMGEVYRARDTRLGREIALKILPSNVALTPESRLRFRQEALAASALNHPNIVTLYDIGSENGVDFIAMEYIRGKTLDQLIPRGGLPMAAVLQYAIPVTKALAAAHAAGIVHRDIKPKNIIVSDKGEVKLLDFGLAKLQRPETGESPIDPDQASTQTLWEATREGLIVGTVSFMSPEQAQGRAVDARSDIFSFGAVLYQMICGRMAFSGDSQIAILHAIVEHDPAPLSQVVKGVSSDLEKVVSRCLRKDRDRRFQHAVDLQIALEEMQSEAAAPARRPARWILPAAAIFAIAAAGLAWFRLYTPNSATHPALVQLTKDGGYTGYPALSPDGKLIAFLSDRAAPGRLDLWVQQTDGSSAIQLTHDYTFHDPPINITPPAFSPDGTKILFAAMHEAQGIFEVPALGGDPRLVVDGGYAPQYSPDGKWIAYGQIQRSTAFVIPAAGGTPRQIHPEFDAVRTPIWSPDNHLLFRGRRGGDGKTECYWVSSADNGPALPTGLCRAMPAFGLTQIDSISAWTARDEIIFSAVHGDTTNLWRARLSPNSYQLDGAPTQITSGTGVERWPSVSGGRMAFSSATTIVDLVGLPLDTAHAVPRGPLEALTHDAAKDYSPSLSTDGSKLVYASDLRGSFDVYLRDLRSGKTTVLAGTAENEGQPFLSPDGTQVVYCMQRDGKRSIYQVPASGGTPRLVCSDCGIPRGWSSDRSTVLLWNYNVKLITAGMLDLNTGKSAVVLRDPGYEIMYPELSPDNRWIAFFIFKSADTFQIFVAPLRGNDEIPRGAWIPISGDKQRHVAPTWSPDGNLLYFDAVGSEDRMFAQPLDRETRRPVGAPIPVPLDFGPRQFLRNWSESVLQLSRDRMVFPAEQDTSNIWLMDLPTRR